MDWANGRHYLDFELRSPRNTQIDALHACERSAAEIRELRRLENERRKLDALYDTLTAWQRVQLARHIDRPQTADYVARLCTDFVELHGDRAFGDDAAIVGGLATRASRSSWSNLRGHSTEERQHFGIGGRNARRCVSSTSRSIRMPILTFIDTQGAYGRRGRTARSRRGDRPHVAHDGAPARADRQRRHRRGGSGGALALGLLDRLLMQEYSCYSVISPRVLGDSLSRPRAERGACRQRCISPRDLYRFGVIGEVVSEPVGGAHRNPRRAGGARAASRCLAELKRTRCRRCWRDAVRSTGALAGTSNRMHSARSGAALQCRNGWASSAGFRHRE
jgi:acetyl-CoA carboxylase carboxyl transferase subunit alpha